MPSRWLPRDRDWTESGRESGVWVPGCGLEVWCVVVSSLGSCIVLLKQEPPAFMALGTSFMEDNFSIYPGGRDGFWMIQALYLYYATPDVRGGGAQAVTCVMGSGCECR